MVGGGQLGKMLIESSRSWNVQYAVLDQANAPCKSYAAHFVEGSLMDAESIRELSQHCDVLTYEIEHINVSTLSELERNGKKVIPSSAILSVIQDKGRQKKFYADNNLPTSEFKLLTVNDFSSVDSLITPIKGEQLVIKTCTGGYDGKGVSIQKRETVSSEWLSANYSGPLVIEEFISNALEVSIIVARNGQGETKTFPMVEMVFDPKLNLVDYLFAPSSLPNSIHERAAEISVQAIEKMNGIGLFAVELFVTPDHRVLINEIAPRPHNSGHHTIEACTTSQYEQLNRILLDLPLGDTTLIKPAVMTNIIGPEGVSGNYILEGMDVLFGTPGASLHWYNKEETRPGRKMGHFTVIADDVQTAVDRSHHIRKHLKISANS